MEFQYAEEGLKVNISHIRRLRGESLIAIQAGE
jgi:hypothetical protein